MRRTLLILIACILLSACSGNAAPTATTPPLTKTAVQFSWFNTVEWSGFFTAQSQSLYKNEGLDVTLLEGGNDAQGNFIDPIDMVLAGKADFGIYGSDSILKARAAGKPIVGIAAIYQISARALVSLKSKNLIKPQDLVGKTILLSNSADAESGLNTMLERAGIDPKSVKLIKDSNKLFTGEPLTSGEADAMGVFITNQAVVMKRSGMDLNAIMYADYGADAYSNVIFTTEEVIAKKPDLVERFLRATLAGYKDVVQSPDQGVNDTLKAAPKLDAALQLASLQAAVPLIKFSGNPIGQMRPELWDISHTLLRKAGILTADLDVSKAYTLVFLNKLYKTP